MSRAARDVQRLILLGVLFVATVISATVLGGVGAYYAAGSIADARAFGVGVGLLFGALMIVGGMLGYLRRLFRGGGVDG